jgi:hypothetical protein
MFPSGWQLLPQTPPLQVMSQQSLANTHGAACGLHCVLPQKPSGVHVPPQQSVFAWQAAPSGAHMMPPQRPFSHTCALQQSVGEVQGDPNGVHWIPPQNPPTQSNPQQSVVSVHAFPSGWQR